MKLFFKFLVALLVISILPLVIYSVVLLNTTGSVLKSIINRNSVNLTENVTREVDKFFVEVEGKLDVARRIESERNITVAGKTRLLINEMLSSKLLLGILLLDGRSAILSGMTADGGTYALSPSVALVRKSAESGGVEIGSIVMAPGGSPYFDVVYPIDPDGECLYFRVKLSYLLDRIKLQLQPDGKETQKNVLLIDDTGAAVSAFGAALQVVDRVQHEKYSKISRSTVFIEDGKMNIIISSVGPGWQILFQEPTRSAYAPITRMWLGSLSLILLTSFFAFFGATVLARNLMTPIGKLIEGIEIVGSGNLDYKVEHASNDELAKVADIFNAMVVKLKQMQEDIKKNERLSAIGQMSNILGHEIKNPLGAITNATYLIKRQISKLPETAAVLQMPVTIIENEIKSTLKIIDDILDFSRSRAPVLAEKDLNEVVSDIMAVTKVPDKVQVRIEPGGKAKVHIDVEEVKQVVRNLVNNAIDSMSGRPEAQLTISVFDTSFEKEGRKMSAVGLRVSDTGCGIPPESLKKIFEPFYSTKSKGTGLGLAVVNRIIEERHKGVIEVTSKVGKGTSFTLKLPVS